MNKVITIPKLEKSSKPKYVMKNVNFKLPDDVGLYQYVQKIDSFSEVMKILITFGMEHFDNEGCGLKPEFIISQLIGGKDYTPYKKRDRAKNQVKNIVKNINFKLPNDIELYEYVQKINSFSEVMRLLIMYGIENFADDSGKLSPLTIVSNLVKGYNFSKTYQRGVV